MTRVLWDTDVLVHWLLDEPTFRPGIQKALAGFGVGRAFYVSTLTTQELMVWARDLGRAEATYAFLVEHFTPLELTEACAVEAARLISVVHPQRDAAARYQRDASIIATASAHQLDILFTAEDRDYAPFASHVTCKVLAPVSIR